MNWRTMKSAKKTEAAEGLRIAQVRDEVSAAKKMTACSVAPTRPI